MMRSDGWLPADNELSAIALFCLLPVKLLRQRESIAFIRCSSETRPHRLRSGAGS